MLGLNIGYENPSNRFIYWASIGSIALSLFFLKKNPAISTFTGLWAPTILGLGILFKENELIELENKRISGSQLSP